MVVVNAWFSLAILATLIAPAAAQPNASERYPARAITLIVPYAAGGSADVMLRILAERMRGPLGRPMLVENVTGAAGSIGTGRLARAHADGYTFGLGTWSTHVANGAVYPLPYDVLADFEPVGLVASSPLMIVANKTVPAATLTELVAWLKANPDKASLATNGLGSVMHLAGILFQKETGARLQFVPYRGAGAAMQDLVAGHVNVYIGLPADVLPQARGGSVRIYAVAAASRLAAAPDTPTVDEAGLPELHVAAWFGLWAPKGTPKSAIATFNAAVGEALGDSSVARRLREELFLELPMLNQQTPEALGTYQAMEIRKWWPIIKAANIKAE